MSKTARAADAAPADTAATDQAAAVQAPAEPERNPADPIGTPPHGGRWTWDIPLQQWVDLDPPAEA